MTTPSSLKQRHAVDYSHIEPMPDPPREPDMNQRRATRAFDGILIPYFADRDDVLISGEGYLRFNGSNANERLAPDCVVAFGVDDPDAIEARNGYVISEVGKPPDFVLEVASRSTGRRDYTVKREGYAGYSVPEYWQFDHTGGRYHVSALSGDVLVDGRYEPVEIVHEPDGLIWGHSEVLGLDLCWDDGELRFRDPSTGEFLPTPEERREAQEVAEARAEAAETHAEAERHARQVAEARAEAERDARQAAETRVAELEAELRRLRGQ